MNMQEAMGRNIPVEVAHQYVAAGEEILLQTLQREPTTAELASFCETAGATIIGSMYDLMRQRENPKDAETWLRKVLALISSTVRVRGSDALLKIDLTVKEAPNRVARRRPEDASQDALVPEPTCSCTLDATGRCASCSERLSACFKKVFEPFRRMAEFGNEAREICKVCKTTQADYAMSTIVPTVISLGEGVGEQMVAYLYSMGAMMGAQKMPLTEQACAELLGAKKKEA